MSGMINSLAMNEIAGVPSVDEVEVRRDEIYEIIGNKLSGPSFGLEFNIPNFVCSGIFIKISGDRIFLKDATQVEIGKNVSLGMPTKVGAINILDIDMSSFKVISEEDVKATNAKVISNLEMGEKQEKHMEDTKSLGFKIDDRDNTFPVPIKFQQESISHVVPIIEPIKSETIIAELPKQAESNEFNEKLRSLSDIALQNEDILKDSKIKDSIDKALAKDTKSKLEARYESLKQSIKEPVEKLNKQLKDSLEKIAKEHNSGISSLIAKTTKAATDTRRKYKLILNKTRSAIKNRLAGKSTGIVGSLKSSQLQGLEKSLGKDETELEVELQTAKRYIGVKKRLLDWSRKSSDKTQLSEAQIETIVEAFPIESYEESLNNFTKNLSENSMSIISLVLTSLKTEIDISKRQAPNNTSKLISIVKQFMKSLLTDANTSRDIDVNEVEVTLNKSIDTYADQKNDNYLTPMKLYDIKQSLISILDSSKSLIPGVSDTLSETSSSSTSSGRSANERRQSKLAERKRLAEMESDTLTPVINRIKEDVDEFIPDIKSGELLLTTERELKSRFGRNTGDVKEKHYYLDVNGKVKKIGSNMTYKLAINADGAIPPQLAHLGAAKNPSTTSKSDLDNVPITAVYPQPESEKRPFFSSKFSTESRSPPLVLTAPSKSSLTDEGPQYVPELPPRKGVLGSLNSLSKGFFNRIGARTPSKNRPAVEGGKRRTRKFRKSKTHKKHSRR
jgi:hypothetical protein